jgi:hypothetical protein
MSVPEVTIATGGQSSIVLGGDASEEAFIRQEAPQNVEMTVPEVTIATGGHSSILLGGDASEEAFIRQEAPQNVEMMVPEVTIATGGQSTVILGGDASEEAFIRQAAPQNTEMPAVDEGLAACGLSSTVVGESSTAGLRHPDAFSRGTPPRCTNMVEIDPSRTPGGMASINLTDAIFEDSEAFVLTPAPQNVQMTFPAFPVVIEPIPAGGKSSIVLGELASGESFVRQPAPQNKQETQDENDHRVMNRIVPDAELKMNKMPMEPLSAHRVPPGGASVVILG